MKRDPYARLFQNPAGGHAHIACFEFSPWRIDQNHRAGNLGLRDFVGHLPPLADMVQDNAEAKFLRQPDHGDDVIVAVRVMVDHPSPLHRLDQDLEVQVPRRHLVRVPLGLIDFVLVLAGFDELLAHQKSTFAARARKRRRASSWCHWPSSGRRWACRLR